MHLLNFSIYEFFFLLHLTCSYFTVEYECLSIAMPIVQKFSKNVSKIKVSFWFYLNLYSKTCAVESMSMQIFYTCFRMISKLKIEVSSMSAQFSCTYYYRTFDMQKCKQVISVSTSTSILHN